MEVQCPNNRSLVVDDDSIVRKVHRKFLENMGFIVDEAETGDKALALFSDHQTILIDVSMPGGMNGIDATIEIRRLENDKKQAFIIGITGHQEIKVISACMEAGMDKVISKPLHFGDLTEVLRVK